MVGGLQPGLLTRSWVSVPTGDRRRATVEALVKEGYELFYGGGYHDSPWAAWQQAQVVFGGRS